MGMLPNSDDSISEQLGRGHRESAAAMHHAATVLACAGPAEFGV
jgi:hypothetical protein